jgi:hypothetical protein
MGTVGTGGWVRAPPQAHRTVLTPGHCIIEAIMAVLKNNTRYNVNDHGLRSNSS